LFVDDDTSRPFAPRRLASAAACCARIVSTRAHSRSPATVGFGFGTAASDGFVTVRLMTRLGPFLPIPGPRAFNPPSRSCHVLSLFPATPRLSLTLF
jgi:hypothetical protein